MDVSSFCPMVNGETYITYLLNWLNNDIFASGVWDGVFLDNLNGEANPHC